MRTLRWLILLAALGAVGYLVVAVDFGGRTLLDMALGEPPAAAPGPSDPSTAKPDPARGADGGPAEPAGAGAATKPSDALTDEDRAGLDKLIEERLEQEPDAPREGAATGAP